MIRCNVCNVEKTEDKFHTYWHSTQNKMRTRKQCTECLYNIRLKRKNPDKLYSNNPNFKKCNTCNEWKPVDNYYVHNKRNGARMLKCKLCIQSKEKTDRHTEREIELEQNCGSERVSATPNKYNDKYQKSCTFSVMLALQYIYDEATGIWYKPGYKEIVNGRAYFPKIAEGRVQKYKRVNNPDRKIKQWMTQEIYDKIFELRADGDTYEQISLKLNIGTTTVFNYLKGKRFYAKTH